MNEMAMMALTRAWATGIGTQVQTMDCSTPRRQGRRLRLPDARPAAAALLRTAGEALLTLAARLAH